MPNRRIHLITLAAVLLVVGSVGGTAQGDPSDSRAQGLPTNLSPPTISGTPVVGETLSGNSGVWRTAETYAYQWERCNSTGICNGIANATGTTYVLAPDDLGTTTRFAVVAANKNGSTTAVSGPTAVIQAPVTTTTTTTSTSPALFDGSATLMNSLTCGSSWQSNTQDPAGFWGGLGFTLSDGSTCDVQLVSDPTFGRVYRYRTDDNSLAAGGYDCGPNCGDVELTKVQPDDMGKWDWYSFAVKPDATWQQTTWSLFFEPMFPRYTSPPEAIQSGYLDTSGGWCYTYSRCDFAKGPYYWFTRKTGDIRCCLTKDLHPLMPLERGKWAEFVFGVKWADDTTGAYKVYTRVPEDGQTNFTLQLDVSGVVTYQWDSTHPGEPSNLTDIQSLYMGNEPSNGWPSLPVNVAYHTGFKRYGDEQSALAAFGP